MMGWNSDESPSSWAPSTFSIIIIILLRYALGQGSPVPLTLVYRKTVPVGRVKNV